MAGKRIMLVSTQMEAGGVQILANSMIDSFEERGDLPALVFLYTKRPVFDGRKNVHSLLPFKPSSLLHFPIILARLYRFTREYKPDVVIGFAHYSSPMATLMAWVNRVPVRIATQTNPPKSHNRFARVLDWICGTAGIYTANIAASKAIEACLEHYPVRYKRTLRTVYNGVKFKTSVLSKRDARVSFSLDTESFYLLNCGRLSNQKNQRFLVQLAERLPEVKVAILGEGELRCELEAEIKAKGLTDRVQLLGEVSPERVGDFLRCGDLFVFPSLYEAFGLALAEAMQAGLPVISSTHPALAEVVGDAGVQIDVESIDDWVTVIRRLISSPDLMRELAQHGIERGNQFSFEEMVDGFSAEWGKY